MASFSISGLSIILLPITILPIPYSIPGCDGLNVPCPPVYMLKLYSSNESIRRWGSCEVIRIKRDHDFTAVFHPVLSHGRKGKGALWDLNFSCIFSFICFPDLLPYDCDTMLCKFEGYNSLIYYNPIHCETVTSISLANPSLMSHDYYLFFCG